ncbi:helix-turn-helix domain-containing protein [Thalassotalea sp. M1531]|uniref:Helix-turn-helix domain-containing protein n=1 Tax=Thalassotalea algicola TaxID=2716224 RepID=A0A7Y0Q9P7_9GAMM|nr:helix-turn-helix domain-containing protein [Thalassotalea algicola]NMP33425.1 helix-turn-helix domain-containing protein [Thalassotalea algicola]
MKGSLVISVTVLGFDYVLASALTGINDLLNLAGVSWNKYHHRPIERKFKVQIASWDNKPIKTMNDIVIMPHCAIQDIEHSDIYLVPSIAGDINKTLADNLALIRYLSGLRGSKSIIGSNSTGSFFLAEAGLLDDKPATTHWAAESLFRKKYPHIELKLEQLITHDDNILCDGGGMAWFDLGLYLVELFCDHETAMGTAKSFVLDTGRTGQLTYSPLIVKKYHNDKTVRAVQDWMEANYERDIVISQVSLQFGVSNRTLIRRFKDAAGTTPLEYLQEVRLDAASKYLVQSNKTIDEITHTVGYSDISSFTKLFKRKTKLSPSSYRARYKPNYGE